MLDGHRMRVTALSLTAGVILWELAGRWAGLRFLPPISAVFRAEAELIMSGEMTAHLMGSLAGLATGYALAVIAGLLLGAIMGRYRMVEQVFGFYVSAALATPKIALVPVLYAMFGLSRWIQVAVVFLSAFFVIVFHTSRGVQTADAAAVEMASAFGATERQLFRSVLLPGALPLILAGFRLGVGHAVRGMIAGEMFITLFGLGALLRTYGSRFDAEKVFAVLLVVIATGLACTFALQMLERRLLRWMEPGR